jgi:hypothetical protein
MASAAASVDGLYAAIARDGELSLYTVEPFVEIARAQLAPAERSVVFVGRQVLVHDAHGLTLHSLPRLALISHLEIEATRLLATSQHYALLSRGGEILIAACTQEGVATAPTRTPAIVERAVGLDNARFLTWAKKGPAEIWDAVTRLVVARVGLELPPDTIDAGATGKHRSVWIATVGGDLIVSRLSDGKTTVSPLPRSPHRIASHPASAWLVLDFDGEPHAVNSVLRTWQALEVARDRPRTLAPSVGSHAYVIVDEVETIARYEVGAGIDAEPKIVRIPVGGPLPEGEEVAPTAPPQPITRVANVKVEVEPRQTDKTPASIDALAARANLDDAARRVLAALYTDWQAGHGDVGMAASKLVELAGPTAWDEALGKAQLGKLGLIRTQIGRCLLVRTVGAFLDGAAPKLVRRVDGSGSVAPGRYRTQQTHDEIARVAGTIAISEQPTGDARLEAWLRGWPLVTTTYLDGELRPGETIILVGEHPSLPELTTSR